MSETEGQRVRERTTVKEERQNEDIIYDRYRNNYRIQYMKLRYKIYIFSC